MRMWLVPTEYMCRQHLLGEHYELHMIVGALKKGKNLGGYIDNNLIFPEVIHERHDEIVDEMLKRGYTHKTPIEWSDDKKNFKLYFYLDELLNEPLFQRCKLCAMLYKMAKSK